MKWRKAFYLNPAPDTQADDFEGYEKYRGHCLVNTPAAEAYKLSEKMRKLGKH